MLKSILGSNLLTSIWPKNGNPIRLIRTSGSPLLMKVSTVLRAEPMKAKKRLDPNIIKAREMKRKKKYEKMIQRQLKLDRQLKPVEEILEMPTSLLQGERKRIVKISENIENYRRLTLKEWSRVRQLEHFSNLKQLERIMNAQKRALDQLQLESKELYEAAVQIDKGLLPVEYSGPVETPAIKEYPFQDGEYVDISRKWLP